MVHAMPGARQTYVAAIHAALWRQLFDREPHRHCPNSRERLMGHAAHDSLAHTKPLMLMMDPSALPAYGSADGRARMRRTSTPASHAVHGGRPRPAPQRRLSAVWQIEWL